MSMDKAPPSIEEILQMSNGSREALLFRLQDERDSIQHQLDLADMDDSREGQELWLIKAEHAKRCRDTRIQQIERIQGYAT